VKFPRERLAAFARTGALGSKDGREAILSLAGLALTICATLMLMAELGGEAVRLASRDLLAGAEQSVFLVIVILLIYGNVVYQLTRSGHYWRKHQHRRRAFMTRALDRPP
jgi:hypothetical protein